MSPDFDVVMLRLRQALGAKDNKELAAALDMKPNAFYMRRTSNSVPFEKVLALASSRDISADWLFFGVGSTFRKTGKRHVPAAEVDAQLLAQICGELERAFRIENKDSTPLQPSALEAAALRGALASRIYNAVLLLTASSRRRAIRSEAQGMAHAARLLEELSSIGAKPKRGAEREGVGGNVVDLLGALERKVQARDAPLSRSGKKRARRRRSG